MEQVNVSTRKQFFEIIKQQGRNGTTDASATQPYLKIIK